MPKVFIDPALVIEAQGGNAEAQTRLLEQSHGPLIRAAIYTTLGPINEDIADDLIQDARLRIFENLSRLKNPQSFHSWAYPLVVNLCRDYARKRKVRSVEVGDAEEEDDDSLWEASEASVETPETTLATRDLLGQVRRRLANNENWALFEDFFVHGIEVDELSARTGWEKSKVYDRLGQTQLDSLLHISAKERAEGEYREAEKNLLTILTARELHRKNLGKPFKHIKATVLTELANIRMDYLKVDGPAGAVNLLHQARALWTELKDYPKAVHAMRLIGASYYAARRFSDALQQYHLTEEMMQAHPDGLNRQHGLLLSNLGNLYRQSGDQETAEKFLTQSVHYHEYQDEEEDYREAQLTLARNLILQEKYEVAAKLFGEAGKGVPPYRVGYHVGIKKGLCELYLAMGDYKAGVDLACQGLTTSKEHGFYHHALQFYRHLKRHRLLSAVSPALLTFITKSDYTTPVLGD